STTRVVASNSLSATGSRIPPRVLCQPKRLARKPSAASETAAAPNSPMVAANCPCTSVSAMGITSTILSELMRFGTWRSHRYTERRLPAQFEALNPVVAGGDRFETTVQCQGMLQRFGAAASGQPETHRVAVQGIDAHV